MIGGVSRRYVMINYLIKPNYLWMTLLQLMLPLFLYWAVGYEWYWWLATLVFYFLYLCIGNNVGMHRFYSHRYFEMSKPIEYFVTWCAAMCCVGSPISYVAVHNIHHKHNDTTQDPHGRFRSWASVLFCFHRHIYPKDILLSKNLSNIMREYHLLHDYYWPIVFANALVMYLISWKVLLFCWLIPASLSLWAVALVLLLQHDQHGPSNTRSYMWFGWGETWHGNHHVDAGLKDHSLGQGRDWTYELCKILSNSKK